MQIKNNYDMTWDRENDDGTTEYGEGIFNGEFGKNREINKER